MRHLDLTNFRPDGHRPAYLQLADYLAALIMNGEILPGTRLLPQRDLAHQLGLSRTTVTNAYLELEQQGLVRMRVGSGTFATSPVVPRPESTTTVAVRVRPSVRLGRISAVEKEPLPSAPMACISFDRGKTVPGTLEVEELRLIVDQLLQVHGARALGREMTQGSLRLREIIATRAATQGMEVRPGEVLISAGAREAIELLAQSLVDPGDPVVIENPGYSGAIKVLQGVGARILPVPVDRNGMDIRALEDLLNWYRPRFIYTVPTFNNPTGVTMSLERRRQLLRLALEHKVPIVEDDASAGLRYDGHDVPTLKSLDRHGLVFYVSTFSKTVFPGLRVGWVAAPAFIIERLTVSKEVGGLHTSTLSQWALAEYMDRGLMERHLLRLNPVLRRRRDRLISALKAYTPKLAPYHIPQGGFCLWVQLPPGVTATTLLPLAKRHGVVFRSGSEFCTPGEGDGFIRLTFATVPEDEIEEGIRRLGLALASLEASGRTG